MAEIKLIALDLDGTLLNENKDLSEENLWALKECIARGIYIVPATGRTVYGIPEPVKNIPGVRYAITINGGKVVDMEENNIISSSLMTPEDVYKRQFRWRRKPWLILPERRTALCEMH